MKKQIISVYTDSPEIDFCHQNKCKDRKSQTRIPASFHRPKQIRKWKLFVAISGRIKDNHPRSPIPLPVPEKYHQLKSVTIYTEIQPYLHMIFPIIS
jgi:hypothetical protein